MLIKARLLNLILSSGAFVFAGHVWASEAVDVAVACQSKAQPAFQKCKEDFREKMRTECRPLVQQTRAMISSGTVSVPGVIENLKAQIGVCRKKLHAGKNACEAEAQKGVVQCQKSHDELNVKASQKGQEFQDTMAAVDSKKKQLVNAEAALNAAATYDAEQSATSGVDPGLRHSTQQRFNQLQQQVESGESRLNQLQGEYDQIALLANQVYDMQSGVSSARDTTRNEADTLDSQLATAESQLDAMRRGVRGDSTGDDRSPTPGRRNPGGDPGDVTDGSGTGPRNDGNAGRGSNPGNNPNGDQQQQANNGGGMPGLGGLGQPQQKAQDPVKVSEPAQDCSNPTIAASNPVCACRLDPGRPNCSSILAQDSRSIPAKKASGMFEGEEGGGGNFNAAAGGYKENPKERGPKPGYGVQNIQGQSGNGGVGVSSGATPKKDARDAQNVAGRESRPGSARRGGGGISGGGGSASPGGYNVAALQSNYRWDPKANAYVPLARAKGKSLKGIAPTHKLTREQMKALVQAQLNQGMFRGPTGLAVTGPDGLTGPHTDLFKKIRVRYVDLME